MATQGSPDRGNIDIAGYAEEAIIHWNGPPPLAQSTGVCTEALKAVFGDKWATAFQHKVDYTEEGRGRKRKAVFSSVTVERLQSQKPKLAFLADKQRG